MSERYFQIPLGRDSVAAIVGHIKMVREFLEERWNSDDRPLAPVLPPPPIDGPDVGLSEAEFNTRQAAAGAAPGNKLVLDRRGCKVAVNNQAVVHQLLSAHAMVRIEKVYGTVFENILGEKVSTKPVDVVVNGPEREHPYFKALTRR